MFTTVKRTLCELILAAVAVTGVGCTARPVPAPAEYAEEHVENVVQHAIGYFDKRQYSTLVDLMQKRNAYLNAENKRIAEEFRSSGILAIPPEQKPSASERTLLALAYAMKGDYPNARVEFTLLMNDFKYQPVETVKDMEKLQTFFAGGQYKKSEDFAISGTLLYSEMNAVVGFLKFARKDYEGARKFFKAAIPHFEEKTVQEYRIAFAHLLLDAALKENNDAVILEYSHLIRDLYGVKGKKEEQPKN